jgi:hypothetical protein
MNFPRAVLGLQLFVIIVMMVLWTTCLFVTPILSSGSLAFVTTYATLGFWRLPGKVYR